MGLPRPFLTASWRYLAMLNYEVPPALLQALVPPGTELDSWNGATLTSMVGFRFLDTRLLGVPIPGHRDFDEVNLRFYVRRRGEDGHWRRAVVFVRELVPRRAIAIVARWCYNEPYSAVPMQHEIEMANAAGRPAGARSLRLAPSESLASPRGEDPRPARPPGSSLRSSVRYRALLGLHHPAGRQDEGIPGGSPTLAGVGGGGGALRL
jgi:uncharacterized protein YqjF (DUF2071 family)